MSETMTPPPGAQTPPVPPTPPRPVPDEPQIPPTPADPPQQPPAPPAPDKPERKQKATRYVVLFAISPNDADDNERTPEAVAPLGEVVEAFGQDAAKQKAILAAPAGIQQAARDGALWLAAVPASSFKLKRVRPKPVRPAAEFEV